MGSRRGVNTRYRFWHGGVNQSAVASIKLLWLIKNKIRDLESFGKLMNYYYTDRERLNSIIKSNKVEEIIERNKSA